MQRILILILFIVFVFSVNAADLTKSTIDVKGMTCIKCVDEVTSALQQVDGVEKVSVDLESGQATIEYKGVELASVNSALIKAGFNTESSGSQKHECEEIVEKSCFDGEKKKCSRPCKSEKREI